ncbi:MAG: hypothetical protein ACO1O6_15745 [Bacteroidota bacterium]
MLKTVVKYLFILGMIFLGNQGRAFDEASPHPVSANDQHLGAITGPETISALPGQLCFTHSPVEESYSPLYLEEQWEEEEECSESYTWLFAGMLPALFSPYIPSGFCYNRDISFKNFPFSGTARCRYLLFRVFRI